MNTSDTVKDLASSRRLKLRQQIISATEKDRRANEVLEAEGFGKARLAGASKSWLQLKGYFEVTKELSGKSGAAVPVSAASDFTKTIVDTCNGWLRFGDRSSTAWAMSKPEAARDVKTQIEFWLDENGAFSEKRFSEWSEAYLEFLKNADSEDVVGALLYKIRSVLIDLSWFDKCVNEVLDIYPAESDMEYFEYSIYPECTAPEFYVAAYAFVVEFREMLLHDAVPLRLADVTKSLLERGEWTTKEMRDVLMDCWFKNQQWTLENPNWLVSPWYGRLPQVVGRNLLATECDRRYQKYLDIGERQFEKPHWWAIGLQFFGLFLPYVFRAVVIVFLLLVASDNWVPLGVYCAWLAFWYVRNLYVTTHEPYLAHSQYWALVHSYKSTSSPVALYDTVKGLVGRGLFIEPQILALCELAGARGK